jgi:hypothetical protein
MTTNIPSHHPASAIAKALGLSKRAVLSALEGLAPTGQARTGTGGCILAPAWSVDVLPLRYRERLEQIRGERRYLSVDALLAAPPPRWQSPVPLAQVPAPALAKAARLQRALRPFLERQHESAEDFTAQGVEQYRREAGHAITADHWHRLFKRTVARDGGAADWSRLEIFLPAHVTPRPASAGASAAGISEGRNCPWKTRTGSRATPCWAAAGASRRRCASWSAAAS